MKDLGYRASVVLGAMVCLWAAAGVSAQPKPDEKPKPAQSIAELKLQLEKILSDTHTPGVSVAIVHKDGPEWVAGLGKSDVAKGQAATDETLFRIGSTSKAFASMSILKLVNEGKLSLMDPVRKLVPEIWFENRWESTDPVRVVDLLEHTTGWDDMHLAEYAKDANGMTLREGLDYYKKSRISRWRPGTRMSYCNSGPAVAGYIVEKITGKRFEDYVTENLFLPIGMKTATYFEGPSPQQTTLYHDDGKTPFAYWHILLRPAGSINASAKDMAAYVQFYLNRGKVGETEVMPASSIDRMELPTREWAAQEGLKAGYGLSNYWSFHDGFVYHGHNGGVEGGLTEMSYMPEYGVGYFYSINSGNGGAFGKVGDAIRAYVTRGLKRPDVPAAGTLPSNAQEWAGWYEPKSPRNELTHFLEQLTGLSLIEFDNGQLLVSNLGNWRQPFVPVSGTQFRYLPKKDPPEPAATAMLIRPNEEGRFIKAGETVKKMPAVEAWLQIAMTAWCVVAVAAVLLYAPFWIIGGLIKRRRRPAERAMRVWPLIAVLSLIAFVMIFNAASGELIERLGNLTAYSFGLLLTTAMFGAASLAATISLMLAWKRELRGFSRWISVLVIVPLMIAALYLAWWGVIGMRTWS